MTVAIAENAAAQRAGLIEKYRHARAAYLEITPAVISQHSVAMTSPTFDALFQMMADIGAFNRKHPRMAITAEHCEAAR